MILISTKNGIYNWDESGRKLKLQALEGRDVHQVSARSDGTLVAYDGEDSIWHSRDGGKPWEEIAATSIDEEIHVIFVHPANGEIYLGTEPPKVYRYASGDGASWELVTDLSQLEVAKQWYTPWGGPPAVRSIAPVNGEGLYLDIHVGGILRTLDGGKTWQPINEGLHLDVHEVATSPKRQNAVYAATAGGFHLSRNQGESWEARNNGLTHRYTRGIAVHPERPETVLISGSPTSPGGWRAHGKRFALFRTTDDGKQWEQVTSGFPASSDSEIDTHGIAFSDNAPDEVLCGLRSGELYASGDGGASWEKVSEGLPPIRGLCAVS